MTTSPFVLVVGLLWAGVSFLLKRRTGTASGLALSTFPLLLVAVGAYSNTKVADEQHVAINAASAYHSSMGRWPSTLAELDLYKDRCNARGQVRILIGKMQIRGDGLFASQFPWHWQVYRFGSGEITRSEIW